jgi:hypothetical protein
VPIVLKSGSLNLLESSGPVKACIGIALPLIINYYKMLVVSGDFFDNLGGSFVKGLINSGISDNL